MKRLALCALLMLACDREVDEPKPVPETADRDTFARDIVKAMDELANTPPEPIPATAKQAAIAPTALGPTLEYSVDKLTKTELVVTSMILPGMGTTTVLERAK